MNDNRSSISLQDQGQSMVFLSLKSKPLIAADCAKWKDLSPCQCPDGSRGILSIYLPPSLGDLECGLHWQWRGGIRALLPGSCRACAQAFPGSKSAELVTAEAMKRLWQMWACSLILYEYWICFFFWGRVAVRLRSCSLFIAYGVYPTLEWGVVNKSSKGAFWEI